MLERAQTALLQGADRGDIELRGDLVFRRALRMKLLCLRHAPSASSHQVVRFRPMGPMPTCYAPGAKPLIHGQIVARHPPGREALLEFTPDAAAAEFQDARDGGHRGIDAVDDETG